MSAWQSWSGNQSAPPPMTPDQTAQVPDSTQAGQTVLPQSAGYGTDIASSYPAAYPINGAPGSTADLESRGAAGPQQLGTALQNQQQPDPMAPVISRLNQQQMIPPPRPQQYDPQNLASPFLQNAWQQWDKFQPTTQKAGIKGFLTNFALGFGDSMKASGGLPTSYQEKQQAYNNLLAAHQLYSGEAARIGVQKFRDAQIQGMQQSQAREQQLWPLQYQEEQQRVAAGGQELQLRAQQIPTAPTIYTPEHIKALFPMMDDATVQQNAGHPLNAADQAALQQKEALYERANGLEKIDYNQSGKGPNRGVWWINTITKQPVSQITPISGSAAGLEAQREEFKAQFSADHPKPNFNLMVGTDSTGNQVAGTQAELDAAGVKNYVKLGQAEADKMNTARQLTSPNGLFALANRDLAQFAPGELEALAPRWNEFLAGKVGTDDPRYVALRTHVNGLLSTALMQAHVGARGSGQMMEHFEDIANAGKMSAPTLKAALNAEREYVAEKAMRPRTGFGPNSPLSNPGGGNFFESFGGKRR